MATAIVDTNVALVANGSCEGVTAQCRLATMDFLEELVHNGKIAVDLAGEIEAEYRRNLGAGSPGVGSRFLQKFFSEAAHRVERVSVPKGKHGEYSNFAFNGRLNKFDKSDRKFVALAAEINCPIYNATDSDWLDHREELNKRGVNIVFLCGCQKSSWFT